MTSGPVRRACGRCGRHGYPAAHFPDGYLCGTCLRAALDIRGACPGCGTTRALPGRRPAGQRPSAATAPASPATSPACTATTKATWPAAGSATPAPSPRPSPRSSAPAVTSPPPCGPLTDALAAAPNPAATARWLARPHIRGLLADLITGRLPLTHQALAARPGLALRDLPARPPRQLRRPAGHRPAARRLRRLGPPPPRRPGRPPARTAAAPVQPLAPAPPHARQGRHRTPAAQRRQIRRAAVHPGRELPVLDRQHSAATPPTSPRPTSTPGTPPPPFTKNKAPAVS